MQYRQIGSGGPLVSSVGLGGHHVRYDDRFEASAEERARIVGRALDLGINYFDTTFIEELQSLAEAMSLLGWCQDSVISTMTVEYFSAWRRSERSVYDFTKSEVEDRLRTVRRDCLDVYQIGSIDTGYDQTTLGDVVDACLRIREQGLIESIGFSSHSVPLAVEVVERFPVFDVAMVPYNYLERSGAIEDLFGKAKCSGTGIVAMKALCWQYYGIPITVLGDSGLHLHVNLAGRNSSIAVAALRWVLGQPTVSTVIPAVNNVTEVEVNALAGCSPLSPDDVEILEVCRQAQEANRGIPFFFAAMINSNANVRRYGWSRLRRALALNETFDPYGPKDDREAIVSALLDQYAAEMGQPEAAEQ